MPAYGHFTPELFAFLRQLKRNNNREWFEKHKARYVEHVRDPVLRFIEDVGPGLRKISPRIVADASPSGGSMFRIYRDVRFSKDKSPYKTWAAMRFPVEGGQRDVHTPGFYLGMGPDAIHMGAGIWHPDNRVLEKLRASIVAKGAAWKRAIPAGRRHVLSGDSLKRAPRGYDEHHPLIEHVKRKEFVTLAELDEKAACSPRFAAEYVKLCREATPLVKWVCGVLDVRF